MQSEPIKAEIDLRQQGLSTLARIIARVHLDRVQHRAKVFKTSTNNKPQEDTND